MPSFEIAIEHKGQMLDVRVSWDSILNGNDEGTGIDGLNFTVTQINERDASADDAGRLGEELVDRYDKDNAFMERISRAIDDHQSDSIFRSDWD